MASEKIPIYVNLIVVVFYCIVCTLFKVNKLIVDSEIA